MKIEESNLDRYQFSELIDRWIFDEKDRIILKRKFLDNVSLERIAEDLDMSTRQINRRFNKAKMQLFKRI